MKLHNKTIGIWGYGAVGKSVSNALFKNEYDVLVYDDDAQTRLDCPYKTTNSVDNLFTQSEYLIPSPGVDTRAYRQKYKGIWLSELDLFQQVFHKPIIAITGSVGKTSVTHMLTETLQQAGWRAEAAGNIGTPMVDMVNKQQGLDAIVLELSSFQLEYAQNFKPDLAIFTNLYPNHLDRHATMHDYFLAKYNLIKQQTCEQKALIPIELKHRMESLSPSASITYFDLHVRPAHHPSGFAANWLIVEKALELLQVPFPTITDILPLEHRLEKVAIINGVTFINDSKSTAPASTLSAIETIESSRILLLLGGLSKGIDRSELIKKLAARSIIIICFGKEAEQLHQMCEYFGVKSSHHSRLKIAFIDCVKQAVSGDTILLSPAGSSFDEFENYKARGNFFKQLLEDSQK